jgi:short-subunit dehydrogenase
MDLSEKAVWITGASSGIGAALARALAARGAHLLLSARRTERLREVAAACAGAASVEVLPLDVTAEDLAAPVRDAEAVHGRLDVVVNNAGLGQRGSAEETDIAAVRRLMEVNFFGPVRLTQAVLPGMLACGGGQLVYTSSILGKIAVARRSTYCASKFALQGWCNALRCEVYDRNIRLTLVCPGWVRTEISQHALEADGSGHAKLDPGQAGGMDPDRFARKMARAIEREKPEAIIGGWETWAVHARRLFPSLFLRLVRGVRVE